MNKLTKYKLIVKEKIMGGYLSEAVMMMLKTFGWVNSLESPAHEAWKKFTKL